MEHLPKPVQMPKTVALACLLMILSVLPGRSAGGEVGGEDWQEIAAADSTTHDDFTPGTKFQFQAGMLYRVGGSRFNEGSEPYLVTIGFNIPFHWDRQHSTWGAGLHIAFDGDGGPRIGPKLTWRTPAGSNGSDFFQLGTCIYLLSTDDMISGRSPTGEYRSGQVVTPGLYFEAEYGFWELFSLTAATAPRGDLTPEEFRDQHLEVGVF